MSEGNEDKTKQTQQINNQQQSGTSTTSTDKQSDQTQQKPASDERISQLEKQLGEMGKTMGEYKEFLEGASIVINTIALNPELREQFQKTLQQQATGGVQGQQQGQTQQQGNSNQSSASQTKGTDDTIADVAASQREEIILNFEGRFGVDKLKDEEKKATRQKIESYLNDFGLSVKTAPLSLLNKHLEKAYVGTHAEKLKEEGKLEGITQYHTNAQAMMPNMGGSYQTNEPTKELTAKQREWVKKLRVNEEKATQRYVNQGEEQQREKPVK